jgi:replicative DNA helicase
MASESTDRLPPQSLTAEQGILGAMLRDNAVIDEVVGSLSAEAFYGDAHMRIFRAIVALHDDGKRADLVTVAEELKRRGEIDDIGGYPYLALLWDAVPAPAASPQHVKIVRDTGVSRAVIHACTEIQRDAYDGMPADELVEAAERKVFAIAESAVTGEVADAPQVVAEVFDHIDACKAGRGNAGGLKTGFVDFDNKTGGLHDSSLVLLAARPSVGKTSLGAGITLNLILDGRPVFFASLEQTRGELMERMMCCRAKVDSHALREGLLGADDIRRLGIAGEEIRRCPLTIDHGGRQTVLRIAANARRMKRRKGLAAVFIDYLQLIEPPDRRVKRYEQVGEISRRLKAMAKELAVPVVAMCQLNREPENRADGKPQLSDLRESGSLEMDADCVVLMSRAAQEKNVIVLDVAKNRNGPTGEVRLTYLPKWTRFENYVGPPLGG